MIRYTFALPDGGEYVVEVDVERGYLPHDATAAEPAWAALGFHRCANCPLAEQDHPWCPPALDVHGVAERFGASPSYEEVTVRVDTPRRSYVKAVDLQTGLQSLFGLVMATSGCPILRRMRPMARQHLPFASLEETIWRVAGAYLLQQYFRQRDGRSADFELAGLRELYGALGVVNRGFSERIRAAGARDANVNAVVSLVFLADAASADLDSLLDMVRAEMMAKVPRF
jgi:hypothetical protein